MYKTPLPYFLSQNPYPHPLTQGFFYREKMRAIHHIAPDRDLHTILEVGGGRSGLTALLYPLAQVINVELELDFAASPANRGPRIRFVGGDAVHLPIAGNSVDAVTMFDVLEHIPDHESALAEVRRVLKPGGFLLVSVPNQHWRFPYYRVMKSICRPDSELIAEWGHVRLGYSLHELRELTGLPCLQWMTFITPLTVICHDFTFSRLPLLLREFACLLLSPLTWLGYALHQPNATGTETASAWQKQSS